MGASAPEPLEKNSPCEIIWQETNTPSYQSPPAVIGYASPLEADRFKRNSTLDLKGELEMTKNRYQKQLD